MASPDANGWMPIETAPKDMKRPSYNRIVLLTNGRDIYMGFWNGRSWDDGDFHDDMGPMTHWRPLPDLPEEAA